MISNHVRYLPFFLRDNSHAPPTFYDHGVCYSNNSTWIYQTDHRQLVYSGTRTDLHHLWPNITIRWPRHGLLFHTHATHTRIHTPSLNNPHLLTNYYYSNGYKPTRDYIIILNVLFKTSSPLQPHTSTYYTYSNINIYIFIYTHKSFFCIILDACKCS